MDSGSSPNDKKRVGLDLIVMLSESVNSDSTKWRLPSYIETLDQLETYREWLKSEISSWGTPADVATGLSDSECLRQYTRVCNLIRFIREENTKKN